MKYTTTITSLLLAASSALAATPLAAPSGNLVITDFWARASSQSRTSTIHFVLDDPDNYPEDTPTECNIIWSSNSDPDTNSRCNNSQYYARFPAGGRDIHSFTLELERMDGPTPVQGQFSVDDEAADTKWTCVAEPGAVQCNHDGTLLVPV